MTYEVIILGHLHMPLYFIGTFTEYSKKKPRPGLFLIFYAGNTFTLAFPFCFIEDDFT